MEPKSTEKKRLVSVPSLIGWLSVCLLAAAFGRSLDARWQVIWAEMGAFGLAAALGLESIERIRLARDQRSRDRATHARLETGLARLNQHSATIDSINSAVRKLAHQASFDTRRKLGHAQRNRRRDQMEMLADYPLIISPIADSFDGDTSMPSTGGSLQQISSRVVSFEHAEPIAVQTVLLTFHMGEERLSFVVDVTWTQRVDDGYCSGGTVLAVGVPTTDRELEPVAS